MKYGKHTDLVEAFLTHIKSGNVDWEAAWDAAWDDDREAAWDAAWAAAWDAGWTAAWDAARAMCAYAAYEIIGHEILAEQNKPLVFLPMFGIEGIEQLKEMVK